MIRIKYLVLSRVLPGSGNDGGSDTDGNGSVSLPVGRLSPPTTRRGPTHIHKQFAYKGRMNKRSLCSEHMSGMWTGVIVRIVFSFSFVMCPEFVRKGEKVVCGL